MFLANPVGVILAAGQGRRFGATKQLVAVRGRPLVAHAVGVARDAGCSRIVVVTGHDRHRVAKAALAESSVEIAVNVDYRSGLASSLRIGINAAAQGKGQVAAILLADQPGIDPVVVSQVLNSVRGEVVAARADYEDGPSHPVAFARSAWPKLCGITGDQGARELFEGMKTSYVTVAGKAPRDVDTPHDLRIVS